MEITAAKVMELRELTGVGMMDCKKALKETGGDMEAASDYLRKKGMALAAKKADRETNEGGVQVAFSANGQEAAIVHIACETDFVSRNGQFQDLLSTMAGQVLAKGDQNVGDQPQVKGQGTVNDLITQAVSTMGENIRVVQAVKVALSGQGGVYGYVHSNGRIGVLVVLAADKAVDKDKLAELGRDLSMHIAASNVQAISSDELDQAVVEKEREILTAQTLESGKPADMVAKIVDGRMNKFLKEVTLLNQPFVKDPDKTVAKLLEETGKSLGASLKVQRFVKLQF